MNALQLYVRNFKQADLTLTGCARKANFIPSAIKASSATAISSPVNRRASTTLPSTAPPVQYHSTQKEDAPVILQPSGKVCITCGADVSPKWYPINESQGRLLVNGYHGSLGLEAQKFVAQRNHQCHKCKKANKQPHAVVVKEETSPPPPVDVPRPPAQAVQAARTPNSPQNHLMSVRHIAPQPWDHHPQPQTSLEAPVAQPPPIAPPTMSQATRRSPVPIAPPMAAPMTAPMVQPPPLGPPTHLAQPTAPPALPPSLPPRGPPPHPGPQYAPPPQAPSYNDWRRPSSQHSPHPAAPSPLHLMNGGHPQMPPSAVPPLAPPNHLRAPQLSGISPPPPPLQNGHGHSHHGQPPIVNGVPRSPRSMAGPAPPPRPNNGGQYMPPYHQPHPVSHGVPHVSQPHHLTNGGPPPRPAEHPFSQVMHPQRSPFSTPHGSPPLSRDNMMSGRDLNSAPSRPTETRQASGASASPSLRNLLH